MSSYNQNSNPFHPYNTRNKPSLPQRTYALVPWSTNNTSSTTTSNFNPNNYNSHTTTVTYGGTNKVPLFTTTYYNKK
jgi:hypothetical protein